jgi:hypothetical protein
MAFAAVFFSLAIAVLLGPSGNDEESNEHDDELDEVSDEEALA